MVSSLIKFGGHIENYHWGKIGKDSLISKYINNPDSSLPYAELWFGAHKRAPSPLKDLKGNLRDIIRSYDTKILGEVVSGKYKEELPFLLKILSIEKALSLQLHPDKLNAAILHEENSDIYPDNNHKPEIAVALSEVHLLYGFRPIAEIKKALRKIPEFSIFISPKRLREINDAREKNNTIEFIRLLYSSILKTNPSDFRKASHEFNLRVNSYTKLNRHEKLMLQCMEEYGPEDTAVFTIPLMNYLVLAPGQAVFTAPNTLHAFLKGDILECMANSDNVIRAGMTPKHKDISAIEKIIDYKMALPKLTIPIKSGSAPEILKYQTACEDFELSVISGSGSLTFKDKSSSAEILLCLEGSAVVSLSDEKLELESGDACLAAYNSKALSIKTENVKLARVRVP